MDTGTFLMSQGNIDFSICIPDEYTAFLRWCHGLLFVLKTARANYIRRRSKCSCNNNLSDLQDLLTCLCLIEKFILG